MVDYILIFHISKASLKTKINKKTLVENNYKIFNAIIYAIRLLKPFYFLNH